MTDKQVDDRIGDDLQIATDIIIYRKENSKRKYYICK